MSDPEVLCPEACMCRALDAAATARGWVEPNPLVGAVLAQPTPTGYQPLFTAYHRRFGGPHAEVEALRAARQAGLSREQLAQLTLFVTLEPCCHTAKQPPCTDAILEAGIKHVVAAMSDPDPRVAGGGIERLRNANVRVELGLCETRARWLNRGFISRVTRGRPWVRVKWAQTLDGRIATRTGHSQWISNQASRQRVHAWRSQSDAILTGIGTVLADDPQLTARNAPTPPESMPRRARRVVVDPDLRTPPTSRLIASLAHQPPAPPVLIACRPAALDHPPAATLRDAGADLLPMPDAPPSIDRHEHREHGSDPATGPLDLLPLLRHLHDLDATHVLVEAGPGLVGSLFGQGLTDELAVFIGPTLLGDDRASPPLRGFAPATIDRAINLSLRECERLGDDVVLTYAR